MTTIKFDYIHDIIVDKKNIRGKDCKVLTIRDANASDVDIILSETDTDFLRTVLNEDHERSTKEDD